MAKPVVVVVDDQITICETIKSVLYGMYDVHTFTDGKEAMSYMHKNPVDMILLDYQMPGMTGYEVLMAVRSHKSTIQTPVIFLTAETNERMKMEMLERGASDYINKPIDSTALHSSIRKFLK